MYKDIFVNGEVLETIRNVGLLIGNSTTLNMSIKGETKIVLSFIRKGAETYLMVVNCNALNFQNLHIILNKGTLTELTPIVSGGKTGDILKSGETIRILPPGGYRIFKLPAGFNEMPGLPSTGQYCKLID